MDNLVGNILVGLLRPELPAKLAGLRRYHLCTWGARALDTEGTDQPDAA